MQTLHHFRVAEAFPKIGEAKGYSTEQIEEYKGYIDLIATMHKTWKVEKVKDK